MKRRRAAGYESSRQNRGESVGSDEHDPMTALSLAPPGMGGGDAVAERRSEDMPAGFWDAMRNVIAREVRDYVTTSYPETSLGFRF